MELLLHIPTASLSEKLKKYLESSEYQEMVQDFLGMVKDNAEKVDLVENKDSSNFVISPPLGSPNKRIYFVNSLEFNSIYSSSYIFNTLENKEKENTREKSFAFFSCLEGEKKVEIKLRDRTIRNPEAPRLPRSKILLSGDQGVDNFLNYWNQLGLRPHTRPGKAFDSTVWKIQALKSGILFSSGAVVPEKHKGKSFNFTQFRLSADNFVQAAYNKDYFPLGKKYLQAMSLGEFLYDHRNEKFRNRSYFLYYLENLPKFISFDKEQNPKLTEAIIESYMKHLANGYSREKLIQQFLPQFRSASNKLHDYLESVKSQIHPMMVRSVGDKADIIVNTALKILPDKKRITPFTLTSAFIMERIPVYMQNQGFFLAGSKDFSIYSYKGNGGHANSEKETGGNGTGATNSNRNGGQHKVPSGYTPPL